MFLIEFILKKSYKEAGKKLSHASLPNCMPF